MKDVFLTQEAKNSVSTSVADMLVSMTKLADAIKDVKESKEEGGSILPVEIGSQLKSMGNAIFKLFIDHGLVKSDAASQMVEALVQVAQLSMNLAEDVAVSGEISAETVAKMKQMNSLIDTLVAQGPAEKTKEDTTTAAKNDAAPPVEPPAATPPVEPPAATPPVTEDNKVLDAIGQLTKTVQAFIEAQTKKVEPPAEPPKVDDKEEALKKLTEQVEEMKKSNTELRARLDKALEDPPGGNSSGTPINKGDKPARVIFPEFYNDPVYDPPPVS